MSELECSVVSQETAGWWLTSVRELADISERRGWRRCGGLADEQGCLGER